MRPPARTSAVKTGHWRIVQAEGPRPLAAIRELFREYERSLEVDLCFQGFERELAELPGEYKRPAGRLLLARQAGKVGGCVALRPIDEQTCELKRLYVRPGFRGQGLGRALTLAAIRAAREIRYRRMRLDTLTTMKEAISLYESLGFRRIEPYYDNPTGCAVFMELALAP